MSNIDKQALRGQSVEGSYYLAECGYCGQVMPSSKLRVLHSPDGEADFYCPHCNAEDCEIFDLGTAGSEVVNAWNYQQKRIEALLDELEGAKRRIAEVESQRRMAFMACNRWADKFREAEKRVAELSHHLQCAHAFVEHTEAFGHAASNGILCCGDAQWNIDASKLVLAAAGKGEAS